QSLFQNLSFFTLYDLLQMLTSLEQSKIAIIGLGYVGLPLAAAFAGKYRTVGFDVSAVRVAELKKGRDRTLEISDSELQDVLIDSELTLDQKGRGLLVTDDILAISSANIFIVTVPTPTDKHNRPVL